MPFSTADWLRCPELKVLSPDVRGLWLDMLCYMWESPVRGKMVKPDGTIYSQTEIIRLIGYDANGTDSWLDKLIEAHVCGVDADGAIFSRRMKRDADLSAKRSIAGSRGAVGTKKYWEEKAVVGNCKTAVNKEVDTPDTLFGKSELPPELTQEQKDKAAKAQKYKYADNVSLTRDEYAKLCEAHTEDGAKGIIEVLNAYKGQNGKRYKSDYLAMQNWAINAYYERKEKKEKYGKRTNATVTSNTPETGGFGSGSTL